MDLEIIFLIIPFYFFFFKCNNVEGFTESYLYKKCFAHYAFKISLIPTLFYMSIFFFFFYSMNKTNLKKIQVCFGIQNILYFFRQGRCFFFFEIFHCNVR